MKTRKIVAGYVAQDKVTEGNMDEIVEDVAAIIPAFMGKSIYIVARENTDFVIQSPSLGDNIAYNIYRDLFGEPEKGSPDQDVNKGRCIDLAEAIMEFLANAEVCGFCNGQGVILIDTVSENGDSRHHPCSMCSGVGRYIKYEDIELPQSEDILPF